MCLWKSATHRMAIHHSHTPSKAVLGVVRGRWSVVGSAEQGCWCGGPCHASACSMTPGLSDIFSWADITVPTHAFLKQAICMKIFSSGLSPFCHPSGVMPWSSLFVGLLVCLLGNLVFNLRTKKIKLFPKMASILAVYLRYTCLRDPDHPSPTPLAYLHFIREVRQVFKE